MVVPHVGSTDAALGLRRRPWYGASAMSTEVDAFLRDHFIPLFHRGVSLLKGDPALDDIVGVRHATRLVLEGTSPRELYLAVDSGALTLAESPPVSLPIRSAVALPEEAARLWLEEIVLAEDLTSEDAAVRAAKVASQRLDDAVGDEPLEFHLVLTDTPDFDEVVIRIGLGVEEPPEEPQFTATVDWDTLQEVRAEGGGPQQLMMGGLRLAGDYSRAMELALGLMAEVD